MTAPGTGPSVAVIGGGWAGCAAAVTLAQAGARVALFEQARVLGGRARRVGIDGLALDNGQHLLAGAYRNTLALIATVHGGYRARALVRRLPLTLVPFGTRRADAIAFTAWRTPAPLHLLGGFLGARGLPWTDRISLIRGFRSLERSAFSCAPSQSVAEYFAATPKQAMQAFWSPLCLAALNTPPERASAQAFANVLRTTFTGRAANSHLIVPTTDLSTLFPDAAMRYVEARGGTAHIGSSVHRVSAEGRDNVLLETSAGHERFAGVVVAVGPHQLAPLVASDHVSSPWRSVLKDVSAFSYESITTIYLAYETRVAMPAMFARLDDAPGQWVFDRSAALSTQSAGQPGSLLAVVISANGSHDRLSQPSLSAAVDAQLRRLAPTLPKLSWSRVIAERRATYACTAGLQRPRSGRVIRGLYLAGDYTDDDFPATLEAATRSGIAAATALLADFPPRRTH